MKLLLTRYVTTMLIIITVPLTLFLLCRLIEKPTVFATHQDQFRFHRAAVYCQLKSNVGNILVKVTVLHINLNIDDAPLGSRANSPLPLTNLSPPIHFPLLRYPLPPLHLVCVMLLHPPALALQVVSHHTDTLFHIPPLTLALSGIKNKMT